jgi:small subunit ribosomal protein S7
MPRRRAKSYVREIGVDIRYKSSLVQKLINVIMRRGKKSVASNIVYEAMDIIASKFNGDHGKAYALYEKAIKNVQPLVEVKSRRVGGGVYQIPTEVRPLRARALAFRWIIKAAASRPDKTMGKRLAKELLDAAEGHGSAIKKKNDVQRMAEANRAFSHYAW